MDELTAASRLPWVAEHRDPVLTIWSNGVMSNGAMKDAIEVERTIAATPRRIYDLVTDLTRMGEWSPENTGGRWVGGATRAAVGARFRGRNQIGWRRWRTTVKVTEAKPGEAFVFDVTAGPWAVAEWGFRLRPADESGASTVVTQTYRDKRSGLVRIIGTAATGVRDRTTHNRSAMAQTLAGLAAVAEHDARD